MPEEVAYSLGDKGLNKSTPKAPSEALGAVASCSGPPKLQEWDSLVATCKAMRSRWRAVCGSADKRNFSSISPSHESGARI